MPGLVALIWWYGFRGETVQPDLKNWAVTPSFSATDGEAVLSGALADTQSVIYQSFLKHDTIVAQLKEIKKQYAQGKIRSQAELDQALLDLLRTLKDDQAGIGTMEQYRHILAVMSGKEIGIKLSFQEDQATSRWVVRDVPAGGSAAASGIRKGDVVESVDGYHIEELKRMGDPRQLLPLVLANGVLGSKCKVTVRRAADIYDFEIEREVIQTQPALAVEVLGGGRFGPFGMPMPGGPSELEGTRQITVNHLGDGDFADLLATELRKLEADGVKGVILRFESVFSYATGGDTALRVAALFLKDGVLAHRIAPAGGGLLTMEAYYISGGKVHRKTVGPFGPGADGKLNPAAAGPVVEAVLDWPVGIYSGELVITIDENTSGVPELVCAALQKNERAVLIGVSGTAGRGMQQTFYPIGTNRIVIFSTSYFLQPDGTGLEGRGLLPDYVADPNAAAVVLQQRLLIVPNPVLPPLKR